MEVVGCSIILAVAIESIHLQLAAVDGPGKSLGLAEVAGSVVGTPVVSTGHL